jgi:hypothetical protein
MSKEDKVSRKDILPQLEQIKAKSEELAAIVESLPECYVKSSYTNSVNNLRKKNEAFLTIGGPRKGLTDEEKAVLAAMRAGKKVEISEVPSNETSTGGSHEHTPTPSVKKGKSGKKN